ncbi:hypothetical protein NQZ68_008452 [Dissostichus eleginoides]|nr:hypothetical protein NQZ68_008452 [Dissostichus eleginoides]
MRQTLSLKHQVPDHNILGGINNFDHRGLNSGQLVTQTVRPSTASLPRSDSSNSADRNHKSLPSQPHALNLHHHLCQSSVDHSPTKVFKAPPFRPITHFLPTRD